MNENIIMKKIFTFVFLAFLTNQAVAAEIITCPSVSELKFLPDVLSPIPDTFYKSNAV